jgi:hypothetical protein
MEENVTTGYRWILIGDWNMFLILKVNSSPFNRIANHPKKLAFASLNIHLHVEDYFWYLGPLFYS